MSHAFKSIPSTTHPFLQAELHYDPNPEQPDLECKITYNIRSSHVLGNKPVNLDQFECISAMVRDGRAIGIPVWAYVHSGATIKAAYQNPFGCPWDSGRSGWVYQTMEDVRKFYLVKRVTKKIRAAAEEYMRESVDEFNKWLNSEVYGFVIRDTRDDKALDSCWGYYGEDAVREAAMSALKQMEAITPCQLALNFEGEQA